MSSGELAYTLAFYFFGALAIVAAMIAVLSTRILRAAVGLAVTLVCGAVFYILLHFDFIAAIQILVYVGGIVVLIVYAIMLTSSSELVESHPSPIRKSLAISAAALFPVCAIAALLNTEFTLQSAAAPVENIAAGLGRIILSTDSSGYVLAFEIISLLLLGAVIGAIVIARSSKIHQKNAEPGTTN